eukprot:scaffold3118_cov128-Isochrysis_galbana.AAC.5
MRGLDWHHTAQARQGRACPSRRRRRRRPGARACVLAARLCQCDHRARGRVVLAPLGGGARARPDWRGMLLAARLQDLRGRGVQPGPVGGPALVTGRERGGGVRRGGGTAPSRFGLLPVRPSIRMWLARRVGVSCGFGFEPVVQFLHRTWTIISRGHGGCSPALGGLSFGPAHPTVTRRRP